MGKKWEKPGQSESPGRGRGFAAERGFEKGQQDAIVDLYDKQASGQASITLTIEQVQQLTTAFDSLAERVEELEAEGTDTPGDTPEEPPTEG